MGGCASSQTTFKMKWEGASAPIGAEVYKGAKKFLCPKGVYSERRVAQINKRYSGNGYPTYPNVRINGRFEC